MGTGGQRAPTRSDPKAEAPEAGAGPLAVDRTDNGVLFPEHGRPLSTAAPCPADPFRLEAGGGTLAAWSICIRPADSSPLCWLRTGGAGRWAQRARQSRGGREGDGGNRAAPRMPRRV